MKRLIMGRVGRAARFAALALVLCAALFVAAFFTSAAVSERVAPRAAPAAVPAPAGVPGTTPRTDRTIGLLQERVRQRGNDLRGLGALGLAYLQKARESGDPGYYGRAEGVLHQAHALDAQDADTLVGLAALALGRHQFEEALDWGQQAVAANDYKAAAYGVVGQALIELGRYEEAAAAIQQMVDRRPDQASLGLVSYVRELYGDVPGAIDAMLQAVRLGVPGTEGTEWSRVQLGHLYFNSGQLEMAETAYEQALILYPDYVHARAGLARVAAARGDYDTASRLYAEVTEVTPLPEMVMRLAEVLQAAGKPEAAAQQRALVAVQQQLYVANGVDSDVDMIVFDADHDRDLAGAVARGRREVARRPTLKAADALAWALYKAGQCAEADAQAREALRLGTRDALMLYHAARIAECVGERDRAVSLLSEALALNPYFSVPHAPEARTRLQMLAAR